ncbi:MAG: hypothetical protein Q9178_002682 [Gyalolechia marmorata]
MRPSSIACSFLLLLPLVSTDALPALDPCWRQCFTHELACKDGDWPCALSEAKPNQRLLIIVLTGSGFCRKARQTSLFSETIICIRQTCIGNRPFDPTALLAPFTEKCQKPISPDILANANALAAGNTASSDSSTISDDIAVDSPAIKFAATATSSIANLITTTYIGLATNADGQQETFTVPALVGPAGTIYGNPVTKVDGTTTPTSVVTLPWPTLPVGYFFSRSGSGAVTNSPAKAPTSLGPNIGVTTRTTAIAVPTSEASSQETKDSEAVDPGEGGTVLEANEGTRQAAKSSLGLMEHIQPRIRIPPRVPDVENKFERRVGNRNGSGGDGGISRFVERIQGVSVEIIEGGGGRMDVVEVVGAAEDEGPAASNECGGVAFGEGNTRGQVVEDR